MQAAAPVVPGLANILARAHAAREGGAHAEAFAAYQQVFALAPKHAEALYFAGLCQHHLGRNDLAVTWLRRASAAAPANAQIHADLGAILSLIAPDDAAMASLNQALALHPGHASALANRAKILLQRGEPQQALADCDRALAAQPDNISALNNRGTALLNLGRPAEALTCFAAILAHTPADPLATYNSGTALLRLDRHEDALACFDQVLAQNPRWTSALVNRGSALTGLRRHTEALDCFAQVLALDPTHVDAMNNTGNILREMKQSTQALGWFNRALANNPAHATALYNRGAAFLDLKRYAEAAADFTRIKPTIGRLADAAGYLLQARTHLCDWTDLPALRAQVIALAQTGQAASHPFPFLGIAADPAAERAVATAFATARFPAAPHALWQGERYGHDKIRLAYLSADFHEHATAWLMAELFELHNRDHFQLTALSFGPDSPHPIRARLRQAFDAFVDIREKSDIHVARLIRAREIDILVDLKGFTADARLGIAAHRPAPVQVSYIGYPGTIGMPYMDYIIADPVVIPPAHHVHYSEKIISLPHSYQVNDRQRPTDGPTPPRAALGLPEAGFVFCCFNNNYKILPDIFAVWMRLLHAIPGSVLWLFQDTAEAAANLRAHATRHGIAPERLVFAPRMPLPEHLARQRQADLFLDTLPYNAHTTASDALWMGLPVLTCLGASFPGRVAASLLRAVGLEELITESLPAYEALALALARDPARLQSLRARLRAASVQAPLWDTPKFRNHLEAAYTTIATRARQGLPPASFTVPP